MTILGHKFSGIEIVIGLAVLWLLLGAMTTTSSVPAQSTN